MLQVERNALMGCYSLGYFALSIGFFFGYLTLSIGLSFGYLGISHCLGSCSPSSA